MEKIYQRTCPVCGKEFDPNHTNRKYCGTECSNIAHKRISKQWNKDNPEKCRKFKRNYYQKNRERILEKSKKYNREHRDERRAYNNKYYKRRKIEACKVKHNNCFSCPTKDGECLFD